MELTGKIIQLLPEQRFNGRKGEIVKNAFVVEWQDNGYTQKLCLEVMGGDKFDKMKSSVVVGSTVLVKFGVSSREYNGRWFTSCNCWYCNAVGGGSTVGQPQPSPAQAPQQQQQDDSALPF
jgi:hypothetical protein